MSADTNTQRRRSRIQWYDVQDGDRGDGDRGDGGRDDNGRDDNGRDDNGREDNDADGDPGRFAGRVAVPTKVAEIVTPLLADWRG